MTLEDDAGALHHVVMTHLGPGTARLMLGDDEHEVSLSELEPRWNGEFTLLWKPLLSEPANLSMGMQGGAVAALRQRLEEALGIATAGGEIDNTGTGIFDETLRQLVIEFQRSNGLVVDGVAGARTRALLDTRLAAADTPLLSLVIR